VGVGNYRSKSSISLSLLKPDEQLEPMDVPGRDKACELVRSWDTQPRDDGKGYLVK